MTEPIAAPTIKSFITIIGSIVGVATESFKTAAEWYWAIVKKYSLILGAIFGAAVLLALLGYGFDIVSLISAGILAAGLSFGVWVIVIGAILVALQGVYNISPIRNVLNVAMTVSLGALLLSGYVQFSRASENSWLFPMLIFVVVVLAVTSILSGKSLDPGTYAIRAKILLFALVIIISATTIFAYLPRDLTARFTGGAPGEILYTNSIDHIQFFSSVTGEPQVWYSLENERHRLWDNKGFDRRGTELNIITGDIIDKIEEYIAEEKASVEEARRLENQPFITNSFNLPSARQHSEYDFRLTVARGTAPYTWDISERSLPLGLTLHTNGVISGRPAFPDSRTFAARVTDSSNPPMSAVKEFGITVERVLESPPAEPVEEVVVVAEENNPQTPISVDATPLSPPAPELTFEVPVQTSLIIAVAREISSETVKNGDLIAGVLVEPVMVGDRTIFQRGQPAQLRIVSAKNADDDSRITSIVLESTGVTIPNIGQFEIETQPTELRAEFPSRKRRFLQILGGAAAAAIIGQLVDGKRGAAIGAGAGAAATAAIITRGNSIVIPLGYPIEFVTKKEISIPASLVR